MAKKSKISEDEINAFLDAIKGTKRLPQNKILLKPPVTRLPKKIEAEPLDLISLLENDDLEAVQSDEFIDYKDVSISNKILRKLRKGQYNVEAKLDLHGMTVEEARMTVEKFLYQCLEHGLRVVLIIHGKGKHNKVPILKNKLNQWLRRSNRILAFSSATSLHGSRGAIYVLLKRSVDKY